MAADKHMFMGNMMSIGDWGCSDQCRQMQKTFDGIVCGGSKTEIGL